MTSVGPGSPSDRARTAIWLFRSRVTGWLSSSSPGIWSIVSSRNWASVGSRFSRAVAADTAGTTSSTFGNRASWLMLRWTVHCACDERHVLIRATDSNQRVVGQFPTPDYSQSGDQQVIEPGKRAATLYQQLAAVRRDDLPELSPQLNAPQGKPTGRFIARFRSRFECRQQAGLGREHIARHGRQRWVGLLDQIYLLVSWHQAIVPGDTESGRAEQIKTHCRLSTPVEFSEQAQRHGKLRRPEAAGLLILDGRVSAGSADRQFSSAGRKAYQWAGLVPGISAEGAAGRRAEFGESWIGIE